ncbi:MAG: glycerophosphodiester phosphodiesterase family protein, partial [Acidimicrobiales bacterium]
MRNGWAFLDWPAPVAVAHRGGGAERPENTMAAFQAAADLGFRYLETDVRMTADGVLVAFHDRRLERVTGRPGRMRDLTWDEVGALRAGGEPIPRFEEILSSFPGARLHVDAKEAAAVGPLVAAIERAGAHDRVCAGAFSARRAARIRALTGGRVCTWMGTAGIARLRLASLGLPAGNGTAAPCVHAPHRHLGLAVVDRRFLDAAHARG